ncbi:DUF969 family protein [Leptotrichia sp. OH3620_COT-345]|uniref:5-oxoproline transporter, DUF969 family subunit n=1 Tax=Leptotrichia sp. OH3620_COT-345 TaxID=2491048 RepID=UPI000F647963|nr:DUF969 family protein [Leptotrichia sp. OH3620_COT-345]RRD39356.1 DUF969 family protein [Leptotrichia sp. OH3620_COT-345]
MNLWILIGIIIIVVGFTLKFDVLAVVLTAGIMTGLTAGIKFDAILEIIGKAFIDNRFMSIFLINFPIIVLLERYGLKERSIILINHLKNTTPGKILASYVVIRSFAVSLSIKIGGHIRCIRPLIFPMVEAAARSYKTKELTEKETEELKGLSAAVENYGSFFARNIFIGDPGILLILSTLKENGFNISPHKLVLYSIPIGIITILFTFIQVILYDKKLKKEKNNLKGGSK